MKIGVLALQGAVIEHMKKIEQAGGQGLVIKKIEQLADIDGIIIPGGESTTIGNLCGLMALLRSFSSFPGKGNRYLVHVPD